jgi:hypothetical protein
MTRSNMTLSTAALLLTIALPMSEARAQADSAAAKNKAGMYDSTQLVSLTGVTVIRVDTVSQGGTPTLSAVVAAGNDSLSAWLAPVSFLTKNAITLTAGDVIDIAGSRVTMAGTPSLIASQLKKGEVTLVLREKSTGQPAWPQGTSSMPPAAVKP